VWPIFSAFRLLLEDADGTLRFKANPFELFDQKKTALSTIVQKHFEDHGRQVQRVGKDTAAWIRLESQIQMEMLIRDRLRAG